MSLLIPTQDDYDDAHANQDQQEIWVKKWQELRREKDPVSGKLKYPWDFEVVPGFFKQSDPATDDLNFNYATDHMGRLKSWREIITELKQLNAGAGDNVEYKLLFLARHGNGYHNQVVTRYGIDAWEKELHALGDVDGIHYGPDPELTELGIAQAKENHDLWADELKQGAPIPAKFFVSPLQRSCNTLKITWQDLKPDDKHPVVVEKIRETIGKNLCDKRSPKSTIDARFGPAGFNTDDILEEDDVYFLHDKRETMAEQTTRIMQFVQELFESDCDECGRVDKLKAEENIFISTHSHAGTIRCFILAVKHRNYTISTGGMLPVVVKGTRRSS
ncbi:uncharacterized protein LODBEIA_P07090 [Lodderomyces beijingensis]|uniref:Phosphoglycerate mutase n=1 Tax=Lodderomyces beijingensis TaxID=1775926 RepID=A0ABP0ZH63_9ASCO